MDTQKRKSIENYKALYEKDPKSKVFAPLAEAYRKIQHFDEAMRLCHKGIHQHPQFPGGYLCLGRILIDQGHYDEALQHIEMATDLAPDNILAHALLGELALRLKKPKKALKAYKINLLLNPTDPKAARVVKKLESLTANEYNPDLFDFEFIFPIESSENKDTPLTTQGLEKTLSLIDAYIVQNRLDKVHEIISNSPLKIKNHPEIQRRSQLLSNKTSQLTEETAPTKIPTTLAVKKIKLLQSLLDRIQARRIPVVANLF